MNEKTVFTINYISGGRWYRERSDSAEWIRDKVYRLVSGGCLAVFVTQEEV